MFDLKKSALDKDVDQFTMAIEGKGRSAAAEIKMMLGEDGVLGEVHREEVRPKGLG